MAVTESEISQQQCEDFRALNTVFWQLPVIMMTLNGGLWFALASLDLTEMGQRFILVFAVLVDLAFLVALVRLRLLLGALLDRIHKVQGEMKAPFGWFTVSAFCTVLFVAAVGAGVTALKPAAVLARTAKPASVVVCVVNGAVKPGTSSEACPALTPR